MDMFALRCGYKMNYDSENLSGGVGFKWETGNFGVKVDYAYSPFDFALDDVHRFSIGLAF